VRAFASDGTPASRAVMFEHMNSLTNALVCEDAQAIFDFIAGETEFARAGSVGCVGYCMSGPFAFAAAAAFPQRIAAAASIHGVRLFTDAPDSPHRRADAIAGELYIGCAEFDDWAPKEMVEKLDAHLRSTGIDYRIEWYPGAHHGFVFPRRMAVYDKPSAERHWERLLAMFRRRLG
jgi:carboxymethylenebutenolidase